MSVINTMLKDLDKRQQPHTLENMNVAPVQYHSTSFSKMPWILLALVCFLFVTGVAYNWTILTQNGPSQQVELIESKELIATQSIAEQSSKRVNTIDNQSDAKRNAPEQNVKLSTELVARVGNEIDHGSNAEDVVVAQVLNQSTATSVTESVLTDISKQVEGQTVAKLEDALVVKIPKPVSKLKVSVSSMAVTEVRLSNSELAEKRFQIAIESEDIGDLQNAIENYLEALAFSPKLHKARQRLAALYYGQGRLASASNTLKEGTELFPQRFDYLMLQARVQQAGGEFQQALASLSQIPDDASISKQKWTQESSLAQKVKNYTLAENSYRKLLQTEATQSRWWMGLAYALDAQTKYATAIEAYRQALFYRSVPEQGLSVQAVDYIENRLAQLGDSQ
ncbi:MAG: MSHA biogenesis protein MshN [Shewanella sp.]|jgi:MSHA biogenesis protein MshN